MKSLKSTGQIIRSHTLTYFNFLNAVLATLVILSGQYKNMLFIGVVISNALIGIIQELKVKKIVDRLTIMTATKAKRVTKSGMEQIDIDQIAVGDILSFSAGDQIVADCEVILPEGLEVNESMLTGESLSVFKKSGAPLYSGTYVVAGSTTARVVHTKDENYASKLVQKARTKRRATSEMQNTIKQIIRHVSIAILPIGTVLFYIQYVLSGASRSDSLVTTAAGVLGMIPEGLVLLTSVSFILGVGRLAQKGALVQEMESIEALARSTVLCLDKTGTITTGNLVVEDICPLNSYADETVENLMNAIAFAFHDANATSLALQKHFSDTKPYVILDRLPFHSARKYSGVTLEHAGSFLLGATDFITKDLTIIRKAERYEKNGFRVLLLAACDQLSTDIKDAGEIKPYALLVLSDEIKEDAKEIFDYFHKKNVKIKLLSGDHPATVSTIGMKAGITTAMSHIDATTLSDDRNSLRDAVKKYSAFGRVTPEKKQALVHALRDNGHIVCMVGDGVNDILALKDADCGIAMANGATAARQAAHIVLTDSNFSSMKDIAKEGRTIIANIERVSALYLTKTIYSILLCISFILLGRSYPFIPIQLTLIGAIAIGIPSFLLTFEKNDQVKTGSFKRHVMRVSLPGAIIMTAILLCLQFLCKPLGLSDLMLSTCNLITGGLVSLGVLFVVCRPFTRRRLALCISLVVLFFAVILVMPEFFNAVPLISIR